MVVLKHQCQEIFLERFRYCGNNTENGLQLILQDTADKELLIFDVTDLNEGETPRYKVEICFPDDCLKRITYDYYLVEASNWLEDEINIDYPCKTIRKADNVVLMAGNFYLTAGDYQLTIGTGTPETGQITTYMRILNSGLLQYRPEQAIKACDKNDYTCNEKKYIEYGN